MPCSEIDELFIMKTFCPSYMGKIDKYKIGLVYILIGWHIDKQTDRLISINKYKQILQQGKYVDRQYMYLIISYNSVSHYCSYFEVCIKIAR